MEPNTNNAPKQSTDSRVDFVVNAIRGREDQDIPISIRDANVQALTGTYKPINDSVQIAFRASQLRGEFAIYLSEAFNPGESLAPQDFEYFVETFLNDNVKEDNYNYSMLSPEQLQRAKDALLCCKEVFLDAFSPQQDQFSKEALPALKDEMARFFSQVETLEQVYECYLSFINDERFKSITAGREPHDQFNAFVSSRLTYNLISKLDDSPASAAAIAQLAEFLDLAV